MLLELLLLLLLLLFIYAVLHDRRPAAMPPGPPEVPYVGQIPIVTAEQGVQLRKKYGDIVTQRLGNTRTVLLFSYSDVKELFTKPELASRPQFFNKFNFDETLSYGVLFNSGPHWSHSRKFIQRQLRELGTGGTSRLEEAVHTEARALVEHLTSLESKPTLYPHCFEIAVLNVLWQFVAGRRYELDEEEVCSIFRTIEGVKRYAGYSVIISVFPFLAWLPDVVQRHYLGQRYVQDFLQHMKALFVRCVEEHQKTLDPASPRDFIDDYLTEMAQQSEQHEPGLQLTVDGLYQLLLDLFNTGSDTMSNMMNWVVYYSLRYPDIAQRCREDIDLLVPRDKLVSLDDKKRLPYLEAFTTEVLRHSSMAVYIPQHSVSKDIMFRGYLIPKDTAVTTCSHIINRDCQFWQQPEDFMPTRFLDEKGCYKQQREGFMPFGIGRRECAGETLARSELFLFTAAILQNFTLELPDGATLNNRPHELLGIRTPADQHVVYRPRL